MYRIEFGKEKSKVLKIGKNKKQETPQKFKLSSMELDTTRTCTHLGETVNEKGNTVRPP